MLKQKTNSGYIKNFYFGFIFLALLCMGFLVAEVINHRFWLSDFEVYYKAAQRISSAQNLYRHAEDGHYVFKYSPASALFFIPFTFFSFAAAKYVYWFFLTILIVSCFRICIQNLKPSLFLLQDKKSINTGVLIAALVLAIHFLRELHLGQVNYLLLFIYVFALHNFNKNKWILFSMLLGLSIFIKPFALIALPYLLVKKNYREIAVFISSALIFALVPALFYRSLEITAGQYQLWLEELLIELSHKQGLLSDANHTVFSVVARYTPIRFMLVNSFISGIYQVCLLLLIAFFVFYFVKMNSNNSSEAEKKYFLFIDFSLLIALIPLLAFTSANAFVFTQILIFVILLNFQKLKFREKILATLGFLFIGGNFAELIGNKLSDTLDAISLISVGTLILIYLLFVLRKRGLLKADNENAATIAVGRTLLK